MQCPHCGADMQTIERLDKYREVIKLEHCQHCGSFWLDHTQLGRLDEEVAEDIDVHAPILSNQQKNKFDDSAVDCPRCHIPMKKTVDHKNHQTPMQVCPDCQSILIQRGQLANYFGIMRKPAQSVPDQIGMLTRRDHILTSIISVIMLLFGAGLAISKQTGYGSFSADAMMASTGIEPKLLYVFIGLTIIIFIIGLVLSFSRQNKIIRLLGWLTVLLAVALIYFLSV